MSKESFVEEKSRRMKKRKKKSEIIIPIQSMPLYILSFFNRIKRYKGTSDRIIWSDFIRIFVFIMAVYFVLLAIGQLEMRQFI